MDSQERNLRSEIIRACRRLEEKELIAASDGNVSCRCGEECILITPSGVAKGELQPKDLIKTDMEGKPVGSTRRPSSEIKMHLLAYRERPDVTGIVHAHPPLATAFTLSDQPFDSNVLPEVWLMLGPVPTAPYATPSTQEVPRSIAPYVAKSRAILLKRHGAIAFGSTVMQACMRMEKLENAAKVLFYASILRGGKPPVAMSAAEIAKLDALLIG